MQNPERRDCQELGEFPLGLALPPLEFARLARELAPEVEVQVVQPGSEISLESR
jgi:hypothetical protein